MKICTLLITNPNIVQTMCLYWDQSNPYPKFVSQGCHKIWDIRCWQIKGVTEFAICEQMFLTCRMSEYINISGTWRITHSLVTKLTELKPVCSPWQRSETKEHRNRRETRGHTALPTGRISLEMLLTVARCPHMF